MPGNVDKQGDFTRYDRVDSNSCQHCFVQLCPKEPRVPIEIKLSHSFPVYEERSFAHFQM